MTLFRFTTLRCISVAAVLALSALTAAAAAPHPDNGDGNYTNPVIHADYSDPDVVRVGAAYYMVSSSFVHTPGLPVLRSTDLVNWTIVCHVVQNLPSPMFDTPLHGKGIWAPSIRHHKGEFYVYYGDPDLGIFMAKAKHAEGPWSPLTLVREAKGWIDPCPLWDENGEAYLVHSWAKSRVGFNSVLTVNRMSADGTKILDDGTLVFDGHRDHPTIEGPKFYKRNGFYYIFAPAGGVKPGWQTVLRSKNVFGPYEDKIVLAQGATNVNGPHQGAWIDTPTHEDWFIHFQDRYAYGRIVHLQPMVWKNDWPVMGVDREGAGCGEPVSVFAMPKSAKRSARLSPQTTDEFASARLGLQWQFTANHKQSWYSLSARAGALRLASVPLPDSALSLWGAPNLLLQKFPAEQFTTTTLVDCGGLRAGARAGLLIFGLDYSYIAVRKHAGAYTLEKVLCADANKNGTETTEESVALAGSRIYLRVHIGAGAVCGFSYSIDGTTFTPLGRQFTAREGLWVGAKVGVFAAAPRGSRVNGSADYKWFRFE